MELASRPATPVSSCLCLPILRLQIHSGILQVLVFTKCLLYQLNHLLSSGSTSSSLMIIDLRSPKFQQLDNAKQVLVVHHGQSYHTLKND